MRRAIFTFSMIFIFLSVMKAQETTRIKITVGGNSFIASTYENATAKAFVELLPLTVTMSELNGNEKYYYLQGNLPASPERPSSIQSGDLMLYGPNCIVLFYETFTTSYSYTRVGAIDNPAGLKTALGTGNPTVTFERMDSTTGIGSIEHYQFDFKISPEGILQYTGPAHKISIIDISGKVLASTSTKALQINDFPVGVYILKIEGPEKTKTIKIRI